MSIYSLAYLKNSMPKLCEVCCACHGHAAAFSFFCRCIQWLQIAHRERRLLFPTFFFFVVSSALPLGRRFLKVRGPGASNPRTHCSSISAAYTSTKILIHIACVCWAKCPNMRANVGRQVLRKDRRNNLKMFSVVLFRSFLATYRTTKHVVHVTFCH